jgi:hypothetical protein
VLTGVVDAGLSLGRVFVANMTGNVVFIGFALAGGAGAHLGGGTKVGIAALMALAMGAQNAAVRQLKVFDLTTTVLTMTLTGIAADMRQRGRARPRGEQRGRARPRQRTPGRRRGLHGHGESLARAMACATRVTVHSLSQPAATTPSTALSVARFISPSGRRATR